MLQFPDSFTEDCCVATRNLEPSIPSISFAGPYREAQVISSASSYNHCSVKEGAAERDSTRSYDCHIQTCSTDNSGRKRPLSDQGLLDSVSTMSDERCLESRSSPAPVLWNARRSRVNPRKTESSPVPVRALRMARSWGLWLGCQPLDICDSRPNRT